MAAFDPGAQFRASVEEASTHPGLAGHRGEADGLSRVGQLGKPGAGPASRLPRCGRGSPAGDVRAWAVGSWNSRSALTASVLASCMAMAGATCPRLRKTTGIGTPALIRPVARACRATKPSGSLHSCVSWAFSPARSGVWASASARRSGYGLSFPTTIPERLTARSGQGAADAPAVVAVLPARMLLPLPTLGPFGRSPDTQKPRRIRRGGQSMREMERMTGIEPAL